MHLDKYSAMFLHTWEDVVSLVVWNIFPHVILVSLHVFFSVRMCSCQMCRSWGSTASMQILQMLFRGHVISADGIAVDPEQLKSFLGLASCCSRLCRFSPTIFGESDQRFVQNFSCIVCWLWVWVCRISPRSQNLWQNCCARVSDIPGDQLVS